MNPAFKQYLEEPTTRRYAVELHNQYGVHIKGSFANPQAALPAAEGELRFDRQARVFIVDLDGSERFQVYEGGAVRRLK